MTSVEKELLVKIRESIERSERLIAKVESRHQTTSPGSVRDDLLYEEGKIKGLKTALSIVRANENENSLNLNGDNDADGV